MFARMQALRFGMGFVLFCFKLNNKNMSAYRELLEGKKQGGNGHSEGDVGRSPRKI